MNDRARGIGRFVVWGFAALGLLAAGAVILIAVNILAWHSNARQEPAAVQARAAEELFAVAAVNGLEGTGIDEVVIATQASISRGGMEYSSGGGGRPDERNVILLDKATGTSRRLLPDNSRKIVDRIYLPALATIESAGEADKYEVMADGERVKPPRAYYLLRVEAVDGKSEDVLIGDLKTGRQSVVLSGIDGVDRVWMQSPTRVALLMRQGKALHYRAIEIPELKVVAARPVEIG
ncbi:MAG TPA: hypothetical protein VM662_11260 [Sphingomonas sp.]|nr:hypothetical protein [Sphingomonas sp.]